jgi:hypothetical protein
MGIKKSAMIVKSVENRVLKSNCNEIGKRKSAGLIIHLTVSHIINLGL